MTSSAVGLGLAFGDDQGRWAVAARWGFFVLPIVGCAVLARELHWWERPLRGVALGLVYCYLMFWVTIGTAFYLGVFILGALGEPVSF